LFLPVFGITLEEVNVLGVFSEVRNRNRVAKVGIRVEITTTEATQLNDHPIAEDIMQLLTEFSMLAEIGHHLNASVTIAISAPLSFIEDELRHLGIE
jgi:hypothetical protein